MDHYECNECEQILASDDWYACTFCGGTFCLDCIDGHEDECPYNEESRDDFEEEDEDFEEDE